MPLHLQPFLHDLTTVFAAPTQVLSDRTGEITNPEHDPGAQGVIHSDIRVLSEVLVTVDGRQAEHIATQTGSTSAVFTGLLRHVGADLLQFPDPQVRLDRRRQVSPGLLSETVTISSLLPGDVSTTIRVELASDFLSIEEIKVGIGSQPVPLDITEVDGALHWGSGPVSLTLHALDAQTSLSDDRRTLQLEWPVTIPSRSEVSVGWTLEIRDSGSAVIAAAGPGLQPAELAEQVTADLCLAGVVEHRLLPWLEQSLADLNSLRMAIPDMPTDTFFAAGAPWYLTLFGRDSLWSARMILPVDVEHAAGTLRVLGRLAGNQIGVATAESPGKIMHELRRGEFSFNDTALPPLYYGTIDATPLWVCVLHDAWRAGLDREKVGELMPTAKAALEWITSYGDPDGDGFLEYIDESGHGLTNQGWKDSGDSVRFSDGTIADGPVALCEVQGYAYEAAMSGANLLDAYGIEGGDRYRSWAADLAERFRAAFWCGEGEDSYPALALDGSKRRVDSVTSNIGHLIGTGMLTEEEELRVARRLAQPDMDSGLGLRTMSSMDGGYSPLSYHCGSVWPHDTAIVIAGMTKAGLTEHARGLVDGLLKASVVFDQRFPELWSGEGRPVPYPASCRPQAWSAASAVAVAAALAAETQLDACRLAPQPVSAG
ncbi:MAG: hypothetical protein QOF52_2088 [Propionibacteriaceae bacterium]|jgi:hypothetical protein|nr:hypothetical protein [Propionibacteriaceae bacterium]